MATSAGDATAAVSYNDLLIAAGSICTVANTTLTSFVGAVKVERIQVWATSNSANAGVACSVNFYAGAGAGFASNMEFSDSSLSPAYPAHVDCRPPKDSSAAFWYNIGGAGAGTAFTLNYDSALGTSATALVDVTLSCIMFDNASQTLQATQAVAAGTLGQVYYGYLDFSSGNKVLRPVSLVSTL